MTPITWQAAVDDEEQRPLLQDILEAAVDDRRQAAADVEEQRPQPQDIFEAAIDGNHVHQTENYFIRVNKILMESAQLETYNLSL